MNVNNINSGGALHKGYKDLTALMPGERFTATITDIKPDVISLLLEDGTQFNAKSLIVPDARIGQSVQLSVKENNGKGQIVLEIVKDGTASFEGFSNFAKEILLASGLALTEENFELVNYLVENKMPIDKNTLERAVFFRYSVLAKHDGLPQTEMQYQDQNKTTPLDKVLFLLRERFPATEASVQTLNLITDGNHTLKDEIKSLIDNILSLSDEGLKNSLIKTLDPLTGGRGDLSTEDLKSGTGIRIEDEASLKDVCGYFERVYKTSKSAKRILSEAEPSEETKETAKSADKITDMIEFMNRISKYKEFMQIPININGKNENCELYVFKDGKNGKNFRETANMLLALDLKMLGRVEIFIAKIKNSLSFRVETENEKAGKLVKQNFNKLRTLLQQKGFSVTGVEYKKLSEPFNILKNTEQKHEEPENRRYSFDMRV